MIDMEFYAILFSTATDLAAEAIPFEDAVPEFRGHQRPFPLALNGCFCFLFFLLDQNFIARNYIAKRAFCLFVVVVSTLWADIGYAQIYFAIDQRVEFIPLKKLLFDVEIPFKRDMQACCFFWGGR